MVGVYVILLDEQNQELHSIKSDCTSTQMNPFQTRQLCVVFANIMGAGIGNAKWGSAAFEKRTLNHVFQETVSRKEEGKKVPPRPRTPLPTSILPRIRTFKVCSDNVVHT